MANDPLIDLSHDMKGFIYYPKHGQIILHRISDEWPEINTAAARQLIYAEKGEYVWVEGGRISTGATLDEAKAEATKQAKGEPPKGGVVKIVERVSQQLKE